MYIKPRRLLVVWVLILSILVMGCSGIVNASILTPEIQITVIPSDTVTITATPFLAMTNTPIVVPPTYTPTSTFTPSATNTPIPTETPIPTPTSDLEYYPAGHVTAPILLYHHVSDAGYGNRYYVTSDVFRTQMEKLSDWGYKTITPSELVEVLINGGNLPNRPVIITFDDGNVDVYQNAFPIMRDMGFVGAFYIVANRLQSHDYVNSEQLQEMADAGWEIGSHSMSHADLTIDYSIARYEVLQSRLNLEEATGESIDTFAYPYGRTDSFITEKVSDYGYHAGMGLGSSFEHTLGTLFYLNRIEVQGDYGLSAFTALLPWSDN